MHIFCTLTSFLMCLMCALLFSISCYIFFSLTLLRVHCRHYIYPLPFSTTDVHPRNKHTEYNYQIQGFIITLVTVFQLQSLFQLHLFNCFFSVTGSSPRSCYFIMTLIWNSSLDSLCHL